MLVLCKRSVWLFLAMGLAACSSSDDAEAISDPVEACEEFQQVEEAYEQCKEQMNLD